MTNATQTLAVIFVVISVLTAAVKWSSGPEASQAFRSKLVSVDTSRVNKLVIKQPANPPLTLQKSGQQWQVSGASSEQYPADASRVRRAIDRLNSLDVTAVATRNPEKFTRYRVDSTGIHVSLYDGENILNSVFVGAPQQEGQRTLNNYVRLENEDAVYAVEGYLRSTFTKALNEWRDKEVWDVEQSKISRVEFGYPADSSFAIEKTTSNGRDWVAGSDTLSYSSVSSVLSRLASLEASGFADSLAKENFGAEKYNLRIALADGAKYHLRLKESSADSMVYLGTTPDFSYVFTLQKDTWDDYVLKPRTELLKNN